MKLRVDTEAGIVEVDEAGRRRLVPFAEPEAFALLTSAWLRVGWERRYSYRFSWLGRPIIQLPEDVVRLQEVVYGLRPDVVVETGIAHGGLLTLVASICEAVGHGRVVGVDVEIRSQSREALESHPLAGRIALIEGDSVDPATVERVVDEVGGAESVLVVLDSNHSKAHVLQELRLYAPLVSVGSYLVAADGIMQDLAGATGAGDDWAWDNPLSAVAEFLADDPRFVRESPAPPFDEGELDTDVTYWPGGWLRRVR